MKFFSTSLPEKRKRADLLILPYWQGKKKAEVAAQCGDLHKLGQVPIHVGDFKGKAEESSLIYLNGQQEQRLLLLGLGEKKKVTTEVLRRCYASVARICRSHKLSSVNLFVPEGEGEDALTEEAVSCGVAEGLLLPNYAFDKWKKKKTEKKEEKKEKEESVLIDRISLLNVSKKGLSSFKEAEQICEGVYLARDLINDNADEVTPQYLAKVAKDIAKRFSSVKAKIFDKKRIVKEKMGLLLAVNRGSEQDPAFIVLEYKGRPQSKDHTVLVGKGVTFDSGGLNLKPTGGMEDMRKDMSGAATALGTMWAVAALGLKVNLTVVVPSTENSIDGKSYKPGDVHTGYSGKSVEIGNTDAEGRLILADALGYAVKNLKPTRIVDFATLTGAIILALGHDAIGMMSNDDSLAQAFVEAGDATYERPWRLPLFPEYKKQLKSEIADIKSTGGRAAGSITAALFLQEFVEKGSQKVPWVHFDIAGTAFADKPKRYNPRNAIGVGVRLMVEFLQNI